MILLLIIILSNCNLPWRLYKSTQIYKNFWKFQKNNIYLCEIMYNLYNTYYYENQEISKR